MIKTKTRQNDIAPITKIQRNISSRPIPTATQRRPIGQQVRRIVFSCLRLAVGGSILIAASNYLMQEQQTITAHKGFINASITAVKAPINGQLQLTEFKPGDSLQSGQILGSVENPRNPQLELQRQAITTRQKMAQTQLETLRQKQSIRRSRLAQVRQAYSEQKQVVFQYDNQRIVQAQGEIDQAQQVTAAALREYERLVALAESDVIPVVQAEQARDRYDQAKLAETSAKNRLQQAQAEQLATQKGIQLQAGGQAQEAELRAQAIEAEIADLVLEEANLQTQIQQAQREQFELDQQLNLHQVAPVQAPIAGVVWASDIQGGQTPVEANEPLLHILDCNNTWVEAFVSEKEIQSLKIGSLVTVKVLGQRDQPLIGKVRSVRAGVGRLVVGEDVAVPPPESLRREVGVQIDLRESLASDQSAQFCGVGQSVEVAFEKSSDDVNAASAGANSFWQAPFTWMSAQPLWQQLTSHQSVTEEAVES